MSPVSPVHVDLKPMGRVGTAGKRYTQAGGQTGTDLVSGGSVYILGN